MSHNKKWQVIKRDGTAQGVSLEKVIIRYQKLCENPGYDLPPLKNVDYQTLALRTLRGIYNGVSTTEIDHLAATIAQPLTLEHPEYGILASRILVSSYHRDTLHRLHGLFSRGELSFSQLESNLLYYTARALYENIDDLGEQSPALHPQLYSIIRDNPELNALIDYRRDYDYDWIGFTTLIETYLMKCSLPKKGTLERAPIERPQHLMMRVALALTVSQPYWDLEAHDTCPSDIYPRNTCPHKTEVKGRYAWNEIRRALEAWPHITRYPELLANEYLPQYVDNPSHLAEYRAIIAKHRRSWAEVLDSYPKRKLNPDEMTEIKRNYDLMSLKYYTHATPTLFAAGTLRPQLSSCYLTTVPSDSLKGMSQWYANVMQISKYAGGIGSHIHKVRCRDAYIRSTNGRSNGVIPMLCDVNAICRHVDQSGKRPATHAIYFSPDHPDVFDIVEAKLPQGNEEVRARHLMYGLWIPDEFMRTVAYEKELEAQGERKPSWYLMCPDRAPGLAKVFDGELVTHYLSDEEVEQHPELRYTKLYRQYVREGRYTRRVSALELWYKICHSVKMSGVPYFCYKDAGNRKSNQQNLGTIECSNLCTEIYEYSSTKETAVCNLASIALGQFLSPTPTHLDERYLKEGSPVLAGYNVALPSQPARRLYFDFTRLMEVAEQIIINLNRVIDIEFYPIPEARLSNTRHRPLGLGVQDLAGLYTKLRLPYDSPEADRLNWHIFEALYYASLRASCLLARMEGPYASYADSPAAKGLLQQDLWERELIDGKPQRPPYPYFLNWETLRNEIRKYGLRNSLLVALMPTASTSVVMGNTRSFEPHNGLVYKLKKKAEYMVVNADLQRDLESLGLWNQATIEKILATRTSTIAQITEIPEAVRAIYRTAWDMSPKAIIIQSLTRSWFVDQGQSMNLLTEDPSADKIMQMQFYGWRRGIKTGAYYTRGLSGADAQKLQLSKEEKAEKMEVAEPEVCRMEPGCKTCEA